jgi:asparagine synthase (glutamine-hydrolysing)
MVRWNGAAPSAHDVEQMCEAIRHRGPDDRGVYADSHAAIGMRRLSIIDLANGRQPIANEDESVWVVFNGEIYNFEELRRALERRGHRFRTTSDTEVIVHLYEEVGERVVEHLRGMFAFAIWDTRRRQLLLARDRVGIKPLFYTRLGDGLAFASEIKSLLQIPEVERRLSAPALGHLLAFLCTPPTQSIIDGVLKLEPGHRAIVLGDGHVRTERYWDVEFQPDERASEAELAERLCDHLDEAVRVHLRSDVPLGAFLSGGIDSSAVVATMQRLAPGRVKTFSIGFTERRFDELAHARHVARLFDTEHHELVLEPQALEVIEELTWYLDEPFGDSSAIPTYMVSKLAAGHVKVVLTGDGGDELFGGYQKYVVERRERAYDRIPAAIRRLLAAVGRAMPLGMKGRNFLQHLGFEGARRYLDSVTLFRRLEQEQLLAPDMFEQVSAADPWSAWVAVHKSSPASWLSVLQYCDLQGYLPLDILTKVDRMTMAHSIEARPPLLDHKLVEFAATIPATMALRGQTTKYLFKRAMRGRLPDSIIERPKQGFAVPLARWFRGSWSDYVRDILLSDTCRQRGIFNPRYIERLLRVLDGGRDLELELWTLVSFELWCRQYLDRPAGTLIRTRPDLVELSA